MNQLKFLKGSFCQENTQVTKAASDKRYLSCPTTSPPLSFHSVYSLHRLTTLGIYVLNIMPLYTLWYKKHLKMHTSSAESPLTCNLNAQKNPRDMK